MMAVKGRDRCTICNRQLCEFDHRRSKYLCIWCIPVGQEDPIDYEEADR